jgi:hypothetical protein
MSKQLTIPFRSLDRDYHNIIEHGKGTSISHHSTCQESYHPLQGRRGRRNVKKNKASQQDDDRGMIEQADMNNERFTAYYRAQNIIPDDQWDSFMESLRRPLPTTFRITGSREYVSYPPSRVRAHLSSLSKDSPQPWDYDQGDVCSSVEQRHLRRRGYTPSRSNPLVSLNCVRLEDRWVMDV